MSAAQERVAKALFELSEVSHRPWEEYVYGSPNTRKHWMRMARIVIDAYRSQDQLRQIPCLPELRDM